MPTLLRLWYEYFWLIALGAGAFNYRRARGRIVASGAGGGSSEAVTYLGRCAAGVNLPWVVMGLGKMLGYTPTLLYYFRPQDRNPFVMAWLAVILFNTCAYAWWVVVAGGAEKVRDLNLLALVGQHGSRPPSLRFIKRFAVVMLLLFPVWFGFIVFMNVPIPK
jgi:hypothetical protein